MTSVYLTPEEIAGSKRYHFTIDQIRNLLVYRKCNGLDKVVHLVGTKILLNKHKFEKWILTSGIMLDDTTKHHYQHITPNLGTIHPSERERPNDEYVTPEELEHDSRFKWAGNEWKKLWGARKYNGLAATIKEIGGKIFLHLPKVEQWLVETALGQKYGYPS